MHRMHCCNRRFLKVEQKSSNNSLWYSEPPILHNYCFPRPLHPPPSHVPFLIVWISCFDGSDEPAHLLCGKGGLIFPSGSRWMNLSTSITWYIPCSSSRWTCTVTVQCHFQKVKKIYFLFLYFICAPGLFSLNSLHFIWSKVLFWFFR